MRARARALALCLVTGCASTAAVEVRTGLDEGGRPTAAWVAAIRPRHPPDELELVLRQARPLSAVERRWLARFRALAPGWGRTVRALQVPFEGIEAPRAVVILAGNFGGDDGFTADGRTIAVDLGRWAASYGEPGTAENDDRIRRILSHEYTHLLVQAWRTRHEVALATPLDRAWWVCFNEGLGNHRSLSARWLAPDGTLTPYARAAERRLAPIFVERMAALARAPGPEEEARLVEGLSRGPFDQKWGALLVALWLADEARGDDRALRPWVRQGPAGIRQLARRHLPADLAARLP